MTIDREVKAILEEGHDIARRLLSERRADLESLVLILLDKENMSGKDLDDYFSMNGNGAQPAAERPPIEAVKK